MESFIDYLNELIFLDDEVKQVILMKHPEVSGLFEHVKTTLENPDIVKRSKITIDQGSIIAFLLKFLKANFW